jgi:hypothetical protein
MKRSPGSTDQWSLVPDFSKGALIGSIGDSDFGIGRGSRITAKYSGELLLRINDVDSSLIDNSGSLTVRIRVDR